MIREGDIAWCERCGTPHCVRDAQIRQPNPFYRSTWGYVAHCLTRNAGPQGIDFCQGELWRLTDQAAADAAYRLGGWSPVREMARAEWEEFQDHLRRHGQQLARDLVRATIGLD